MTITTNDVTMNIVIMRKQLEKERKRTMTGYIIGQYVGYFAIMLIGTVLGIIFAKKAAGWILFLLGAGITLLSLIGTQKQMNALSSWGFKTSSTTYWIIYIALVLVGIIVINLRRNSDYSGNSSYPGSSGESESVIVPKPKTGEKKQRQVNSRPQPQPVEETYWKCAHCGVENSSNYGQCKKCGTYRNN